MKLYELTEEMNNLMNSEEEVTETALQKVFGDIQVKAQSICQFITVLESDAEAFKAEEKRIAERRKAMENRAKQIKEYVKMNMQALSIPEIKAGTFTLKLQDNPPAVEVLNESAIPARFFTIIPETKQLDKKRVADAIKAGESIEGARLTRGQSLRIK